MNLTEYLAKSSLSDKIKDVEKAVIKESGGLSHRLMKDFRDYREKTFSKVLIKNTQKWVLGMITFSGSDEKKLKTLMALILRTFKNGEENR